MRKSSNDNLDPQNEPKENDMDQDIQKHLGGQFLRQEDLEFIEKKIRPNYDDFNLQTSWSMKKKFVFAKPGKKRFVSQASPASNLGNLKFGSARKIKEVQEKAEQPAQVPTTPNVPRRR